MLRLLDRWRNRHRHDWETGTTLLGWDWSRCATCGKFVLH